MCSTQRRYMRADPPPPPPVWYATYDFYLLRKYRYRTDIAIFWQYCIDIVSNSKNQYRCITNGKCKLLYWAGHGLLTFPLLAENVPCPPTSKHLLEMLRLKCSVNGHYNITNYNNILYSISLQNLTAVLDNKKQGLHSVKE